MNCLRRARGRRQNGADRKRTWKLRTPSILSGRKRIWGVLRCNWRTWVSWGSYGRWQRREHFWCTCNSYLSNGSYDGTQAMMSFRTRHTLIITLCETRVVSHGKMIFQSVVVCTRIFFLIEGSSYFNPRLPPKVPKYRISSIEPKVRTIYHSTINGHHRKISLNSFHLNGHTFKFVPQP